MGRREGRGGVQNSGVAVTLKKHHKRVVFFSQVEDGIRDAEVTGVQTCAIPISRLISSQAEDGIRDSEVTGVQTCDRKSTRLNSSHLRISYAVFCLNKKRDRKSTRLNSSNLRTSYVVFCLKRDT